MNSKIGKAELTGVAEGVEQKLHMDVTELVSKVFNLVKVVQRQKKQFYKRKYFTHIPGLSAFLKDLTAVSIELTVIIFFLIQLVV